VSKPQKITEKPGKAKKPTATVRAELSARGGNVPSIAVVNKARQASRGLVIGNCPPGLLPTAGLEILAANGFRPKPQPE
jgi:hypothetical protein